MKVPATPPAIKEEELPTIVTLVYDNKLNEIWSKLEEEYYSWEEIKRKKWLLDSKLDITNWWKALRFKRTIRQVELYPFRNLVYQFTYNLEPKMLQLIDGFEKEIGRGLVPSKLQDAEEKEKHLWASIMEEAVASSQIEGAVITREQAFNFISENRNPKNEAEQMIINNYLTIKFIKENANRKLDEQLLQEIQNNITTNTLTSEDHSGTFRVNDDVKVVDAITGDVYFTPVSIKDLNEALTGFYAFANDEEGDFIPPLIKAIIIHFLLAYLHPFRDGNGRTARALFYWYLIRKGYWWMEYLSISRWILEAKNQYYRAFLNTETDKNDLNYFIYYNLFTLEKAHQGLLKYIEKKKIEKKLADEILFNTEGINQRQANVIAELQTNPKKYYTVSKLQELEGVSYLTARSDLQGLVDKSILFIRKNGNKQLYYLVERN